MSKNRKVLFIIKQRYCYGQKTKSYGLYNSCDFVSHKLNELGIESKVVQVVDNNCIDKEVSMYKPTDVFIEALWVVPDKFKVLSKLHPNITWHIRLHSKTPFMATEGIAFEWINQYIELRKQGIKINLSANSEDLFEDLSALFDDAVNFTPNLYYPQKTEHSCSINEYRNCEHEIHIGIFGALRPLKNHLKQAIWAIEYGKKLNRPVVVHINATEHESSNPQTGSVIRNVRNLFKSNENRLVEHPWYPHKDFLNVVSKMDFGLQVSFSETFNITAADFVYMGVPIIVSDEVKFVNPLSRLNNSTSNEEALETIELTTSFISCGLGMMNRYLLNKSNSKSVECWKNLLIA